MLWIIGRKQRVPVRKIIAPPRNYKKIRPGKPEIEIFRDNERGCFYFGCSFVGQYLYGYEPSTLRILQREVFLKLKTLGITRGYKTEKFEIPQ